MDQSLGAEGVTPCGVGLGWVDGKGQTLAYPSRRELFGLEVCWLLNPDPRGSVTCAIKWHRQDLLQQMPWGS